MANCYWQRLAPLPLPNLDGKQAIGLSPWFRFYKYKPGQKFNMHKDGSQQVGEHHTLLTLLIYLNQDCVGGETLFRLGNTKIAPRTGRAAVFEHTLWHQGSEVSAGVKYALRSDIVYG